MGDTVEWLADVGEIRRLAKAYNGVAGDEPGRPSDELLAYLRVCMRERDMARIAVAVHQIRGLLEMDQNTDEFSDLMDALPLPRAEGDRSVLEWLSTVADLLEGALKSHRLPSAGAPGARFEWTSYYPSLARIITDASHQDVFALYGTLSNALLTTVHGCSMSDLARTIGQIHEILAWKMSEQSLIDGIHQMGFALDVPISDAHEYLLDILRRCESEISSRRDR
jgi:hypothetical protein